MNYYLHLNGNVGTESSASLARLVISVARVQFCPRPFVRHFTPPPVCPQQFQSHKAVGVCRGVCVCVCTCSTIGSCSGGFLFSTPIVNHTWNAVSCSAKKGLCCGHKKQWNIYHHFKSFILLQLSLSFKWTHTHTHAHNEVVLQLQAHHFIKTWT